MLRNPESQVNVIDSGDLTENNQELPHLPFEKNSSWPNCWPKLWTPVKSKTRLCKTTKASPFMKMAPYIRLFIRVTLISEKFFVWRFFSRFFVVLPQSFQGRFDSCLSSCWTLTHFPKNILLAFRHEFFKKEWCLFMCQSLEGNSSHTNFWCAKKRLRNLLACFFALQRFPETPFLECDFAILYDFIY